MGTSAGITVSRRELLRAGAGAVAVAAAPHLAPELARAQTPKRGGVFRIRGEDPVHFDPHQTLAFRTMTNLSFTHSRLLKVKAGAGVKPNTTPLEGDLAESWTQTGETTYVFKLRKGVRWHPKPPVDGRELTAEDVKYTYERFLGIKGNPNRGTLEQIDRIEAVDRHTVRITLKEPYAWFPEAVAQTSTWIVPREAVETFGDLKKPEACIGTGPWMLERYEPNVRLTFVRNPHYFLPGLPHADGVEVSIDNDVSSRTAAWFAGRYDFAPEFGQVVRRLDLDLARERKPGLQTAEHVPVFGGITWMKLDQEPFKDVRVRRALARAGSWREILETNAWSLGHGVPNPAIPAAFKEWSIPTDQLPPEGRQLYEQDVKDARRLLAEAGLPNGFKTPYETTPGYGSDYMDAVQITLKNWKAGGIETDLKLKEYGAFVSSTIFGRFEKLAGGLFGAWTEPDSYLYRLHIPGQITNAGGVNDPKLTEMIRLQRRTFDAGRRREILHDIQRYLSQQVYYLYGPSPNAVSAWEPYVRNFAPNFGFDYGGRLMVAWIDR
jgi:peptide/nickel transport system substrate-binding protein